MDCGRETELFLSNLPITLECFSNYLPVNLPESRLLGGNVELMIGHWKQPLAVRWASCPLTFFFFFFFFLQLCGILILAVAIWVRLSKDGQEVNKEIQASLLPK